MLFIDFKAKLGLSRDVKHVILLKLVSKSNQWYAGDNAREERQKENIQNGH